ncbi:aminopeptidase N-like [Coccinella septempunctata]|uniref:aminopeptidase N-like n=1 Tax=Coccinella septempunctata TaxID=41139 RepID=UPI001D06109C|nr:aminopeptidase N-like [Coccinella septempunctata]
MVNSANYMNSNPTQFLKGDTEAVGWFVTTKKALALVALAIFTLIFVIVFMYYYGPNRKIIQIQEEDNDIEEILKEELENKIEKDIRLPKNLSPIHYKLIVHPVIDPDGPKNFSYTGHVQITVLCREETDTIFLNWYNVNVTNKIIVRMTTQLEKTEPEENNLDTSISTDFLGTEEQFDQEGISFKTAVKQAKHIENVLRSDGIEIGVNEIQKDKENAKLKIKLKDNMQVNKNYTIDIEFSGKISDNLIGLYRTSYNTTEGESRWLVTTDFEPIHARRLFPCFDEPHFKATFDLSIARRKNMTTLANTPLKMTEKMENDPEWVWDHFERTPPMSTCSLAFTISDFVPLKCNSTCPNSIVKIWGPISDLSKGDFALKSAAAIIDYLEKYFGIKYPLPKLDLLAVPNLAQAATENWGLISFRKSSLLFDPSKESVLVKPQIFNVLCKNIIKQWMGNLVSIRWWSELWLKEGFAMLLSAQIEKDLKPDWDTYNNIPLMEIETSLFEDSLNSSSSLRTKIVDNEQIEQITDSLIYEKGSSLLRMLNNTVTQPVFEGAIRNYLRIFSYKSAGQDELWAEIVKASDIEGSNQTLWNEQNLKIIMDSWTKQPGYPCIFVTKKGNESGVYTITQNRFGDENGTRTWFVPITYIKKNSTEVARVWLNNEKSKTVDTNASEDSWILVNIRRKGFYRVNYDDENWKLLREQLEEDHHKIPLSNRAQLLDDSFEQAKMGNLDYSIPFELTNFLKYNESAYVAWYPALNNLKYIKTIMDYHEYSGIYHTFLINLIARRFNILGTSPRQKESINDKFLRLEIINLACHLYYEPCIDWAKTQLKRWMEQNDPDLNNPIHRDYRKIVQCMAIEKGSRKEWYFLWDRTYNPNISPEDLNVIYLSLGCTHDPWLINKYLHLSLTGNISLENVPLVWKSLNHPVGLRTGFPFLRMNWNEIFEQYKDIFFVLKTIINDFLSNLATEVDLEDLTQFYKIHQDDLEMIAGIMQETVNKIKLRIEWKKKHLDSVVQWLNSNVKKNR